MTEVEAIKCAMKDKRVSQARLAAMCGFKNASNIGMLLGNGKKCGVRFDNFQKIMNALEYEITITNINNPSQQYVIDGEYDGIFD